MKSTRETPVSHQLLQTLASDRLVIEAVEPQIDGGRFMAKTVVGHEVDVRADIFGEGHEMIAAALVREDGTEVPMVHLDNDRWGATVTFAGNGRARLTPIAWRNLFGTWLRDTRKKVAAGQDVSVEREEALLLLARALEQGRGDKGDRAALRRLSKAAAKAAPDAAVEQLTSVDTADLMERISLRADVTTYPVPLHFWVDRERAAYSAWYELFPRSLGTDGAHGTFHDVIAHLPYVRDLGFDTLYFTPIHPIGTTNRKGPNNTLTPGPDDVGSPYAIGSPDGGNEAVHPDLGTLEDFDRLVAAAADHGLEIAMDIALNASPDHPWIGEHPDWFERRPDGTIKYAENPPKKYEDIVNFRYYLDDGQPNEPFWRAIRDMFLFWAARGVLSFRVDNPHTKPFPFWEWIITEVQAQYPGAIFLSEAFTRPKVMKRLAKVGFNQSYSYFTWRNTKAELTEYLTELTTTDTRHVMRPNFFITTPDINPVFLQTSGRPGFRTRLILAASLSPLYGVYSGYELCEAAPLPGREEYLDSEKYELRPRDFDAPGNIKDDIRLINRLRHDHPALQRFANLAFHGADHDAVLAYAKTDAETGETILFHVLLDPHNAATFGFEVPMWTFGLPDDASVEVTDLVQGNVFTWHGKTQQLTLDPDTRPYAIWKLTPPGGARR